MTLSASSSTADITSAKTSELLAFYNAHRTPIVKFRDRVTAERRCTDLLQELAPKTISIIVAAPAAPIQVAPSKPSKTYLFAFNDHSGSMGRITRAAARDWNATLTSAQGASTSNGIETGLTVYRVGGGFRRSVTNVPIQTVRPIGEHEYDAPGHDTPLFAAIEDGIDFALSLPDASDPEVNFLFVATTDGQDNVTRAAGGRRLAARIKQLQNTDRWTIVFRVPKGDARELAGYGIDAGNILEWEQSERGFATAAVQNTTAMNDFYSGRKLGLRSTKTFYTSVANVTEADVKKLGDISHEVSLWPVATKEEGSAIREFVEGRLKGEAMLKGAAFYQLVKVEDKIQDYKLIAIRDKDSGQIFCGPEARGLIGLPQYGDARVRPDTAGKWQVFVQSTSVNRKVNGGTQLMYWPNVGKRFTEGKSAR